MTVFTRLKLFAGIAPALLLPVSAAVAVALSALGSLPSELNTGQFAAARAAQELDTALYRMEWGRTRPDAAEIVLDQQRRFAELLDSAAHHVYTREQWEKLKTLREAAKPTLEALRRADPRDDSLDPKMRRLHVMAADLRAADEAALVRFSAGLRSKSRELILMVLVAGALVPWICYAVIWRLGGSVRGELRVIRQQLERLDRRPAQAEIEEINRVLTGMGFPRPGPMRSEE